MYKVYAVDAKTCYRGASFVAADNAEETMFDYEDNCC